MTFLRDLFHAWTGKKDTMSVSALSVKDLKNEREGLEKRYKIKKDSYIEAKNMRDALFNRLVSTDNNALRRELASEVASFEARMIHMKDDQMRLLNGMSVTDGLLALKAQERSLKDSALLEEVEELSRYSVIQTLMDPAAVRLVKSGDIEGFLKVVKGQDIAKGNPEVEDVLADADKASGLVGRNSVEIAIKKVLDARDKNI